MRTKAQKRNHEFTPKTIRIISGRAGYRCSYPGCGRRLIGPGEGSKDITNLAEVGHIYSGSASGPRFDNLIDREQLRSPWNGILLCRHHHTLVDSLESRFTVPDLIRMKHRHEYQVSAELGVVSYPPVWIDSVIFDDVFLFESGAVIQLGRVNHVYGSNGLGKTAILEILNSALTGIVTKSWSDRVLMLKLRLSTIDKEETTTNIRMHHKTISYECGQNLTPLFPEPVFVVYLRNALKGHSDDIEAIRRCYDLPRGLLERLIGSGSLRGVTTSRYSVGTVRERPYLARELNVDIGHGEPQSFGNCSGSEKARVILDLGVATASAVARYRPVVLLIDWVNIGSLDVERFGPYIDDLFSSQALFQTIFVSPDPISKLAWTGWQKIWLKGPARPTSIVQWDPDSIT